MTIKVQIKSNYGQEAIYPLCEVGFNITQLTGRKTLTRTDIKVLKRLGYSIEVQSQTL